MGLSASLVIIYRDCAGNGAIFPAAGLVVRGSAGRKAAIPPRRDRIAPDALNIVIIGYNDVGEHFYGVRS